MLYFHRRIFVQWDYSHLVPWNYTLGRGVLDVIGMNTAEVDTDSKPNKSKNLFEVRKSNLTGLISLLRQNIFEAGKKTD